MKKYLNIFLQFFLIFLLLQTSRIGCTSRKTPLDNNSSVEKKASHDSENLPSIDLANYQADSNIARSQADSVFLKGKRIVAQSSVALMSALFQAIQKNKIAGAIKYCNVRALPIIDSIARSENVLIKRTSLLVRNPLDSPTPQERDILQSYLYESQKGAALQPVIRKLKNDTTAYYHPILIAMPQCLSCHGKVGENIAPQDYAVIKSLYPHDKAINYQKSDFRGIWSVKIWNSAKR
jgi:hypothetical protein